MMEPKLDWVTEKIQSKNKIALQPSHYASGIIFDMTTYQMNKHMHIVMPSAAVFGVTKSWKQTK